MQCKQIRATVSMNSGLRKLKFNSAEKESQHSLNSLAFLLSELIRGAFDLNFQISATNPSLSQMPRKKIIFGYTDLKKLNWPNFALSFNIELIAK
ncbi:hypothetical protein ACMAY7_02820 [Rhodobacteraceae bacterium nBUS_24]